MKPDLWTRVETLFHAALERPQESRAAFLDEACQDDAELRREVLRLLSMAPQAAGFLEDDACPFRQAVDALLALDADALPVTPPPSDVRQFLRAGKRLGPYEIESVIGAGGMGEVYRARDTRLDRIVAIKVLPARVARGADSVVSSTPWRTRFAREAKAIASLNHPHVCALHDVGDEDGLTFLVMEYIEGQTLADIVQRGPLPMDQALRSAIEMADALVAAHRQGVIHRDLKPANVMVTADGHVKVLDFGLAKHTGAPLDVESASMFAAEQPTQADLSGAGVILGTPSYLAPEQVEGTPADERSDIFSFGAVLYELLTGQKAFPGGSPFSIMSAILHDTPPPVRRLRSDIPEAFEAVVARCLEKDSDRRYRTAAELHRELVACEARLAAQPRWRSLLGDWRVAAPALVVVAALLASTGWSVWRLSRVTWARTSALPEIARLIDEGRNATAFRLIRRVEGYLPSDPEIARLRSNYTRRVSFVSEPPAADVEVRDYLDTGADAVWDRLGRTPLEQVSIPAGHLAYRISKPGYVTAEGYTAGAITSLPGLVSIKLDADETTPPGMVRVPEQPPLVGQPGMDAFWMDKYEVTNAQYQEFVDHGGYAKVEYWREPIIQGGHDVDRVQAISRLTDATGRQGPATWRSGTFPSGHGSDPVGGVSWYEAAAYCESKGKALPTVRHWWTAAHQGGFTTILQVSNFNGRGPAAVGRYAGLGPFGTYDAAGNVREWCLNASGANRVTQGGAWDDPPYLFQFADTRPPLDRAAGNGFRCAKYTAENPPELTAPVDVSLVAPGRATVRPASDEVFQTYRALHSYDHGELAATLEAVDDRSPFWRLEKVSFRAAYGGERVVAYLYLPKNADPPFQTVITFPGTYAIHLRSSERLETQWFDFFIRSGRAVVHPIYKGMYERTIGVDFETDVKQPNLWREMAIDWHKDLGRALDYLETRKDIDRTALAYHGISLGTTEAPRLLALEPRLKVAILFWGGFLYRGPAEVSSLHFAPRSTVPTLMVSGRSDTNFPESDSQLPMFQALGTPEAHKRRLAVDAGHVAFNQRVVREAVAWLDKYLGPVRTR